MSFYFKKTTKTKHSILGPNNALLGPDSNLKSGREEKRKGVVLR